MPKRRFYFLSLLGVSLLGARAQSWTGETQTFEYPYNTQCAASGKIAAAVTTTNTISRSGSDPLSACVEQTDAASR